MVNGMVNGESRVCVSTCIFIKPHPHLASSPVSGSKTCIRKRPSRIILAGFGKYVKLFEDHWQAVKIMVTRDTVITQYLLLARL